MWRLGAGLIRHGLICVGQCKGKVLGRRDMRCVRLSSSPCVTMSAHACGLFEVLGGPGMFKWRMFMVSLSVRCMAWEDSVSGMGECFGLLRGVAC